jgi:hypothetical protein
MADAKGKSKSLPFFVIITNRINSELPLNYEWFYNSLQVVVSRWESRGLVGESGSLNAWHVLP